MVQQAASAVGCRTAWKNNTNFVSVSIVYTEAVASSRVLVLYLCRLRKLFLFLPWS